MAENRYLYLHLTDQCNLCCLHCYNGERLIKKRQMTLPFLKKALDLFANDFDMITLTGGEAILSPIFYQAIELIAEKGLPIRLDTNGQELDDFFAKLTPEIISEIRFSLDGSGPEINDTIRRKAGSFAKCVANIRKAVDLDFEVELTTTVTKQNYNDVSNIIALAKQLRVDVMNFHLVTVNGNSCANNVELPPELWLNIVENTIKPQTGITIKYPPRFAVKNIPKDYCGCVGQTNNRLSVFAGGQAFNCALYFDTDLNAMQIKDDRIILSESLNEITEFNGHNKKHCGACQKFYGITTFDKEDLEQKNIIPLCIYYKKIINQKL